MLIQHCCSYFFKLICTKFTDSNECESNEVCVDVALSTSSLTDTYYHKVQISPNPVVDILNLSLPSSKTSSYLQIFNARGLRVRELTLYANQNNLNLDLGSCETVSRRVSCIVSSSSQVVFSFIEYYIEEQFTMSELTRKHKRITNFYQINLAG